ncbi:hypothetical protein M407DRAFT_211164 [Tulasnella calospora MUT 4182]|uniref:NYN domain-containing protein n=1 Tax=Tulasnella calospora MUT 4182 TaxID=1051891 RepID=A0A0C3QH79_9AGAM|nr:hypothetical protein M407DRAFT_211164 [Tulasnella calospora MUT 4182]
MRPSRPLRSFVLEDPFSIDMLPSESTLCPPPPRMSGAVFASKIRDEMCSQNGNHFSLFKVYTTTATPIPEPFRTELQNSGAQIFEGDGSTADKIRRTVDILTWALTVSRPAAILFISSDSDFASVLSALENRSCNVSLLLHPDAPSTVLLDHAAGVLEWNKVFNQGSSDHPKKEWLIDLTSDEREMAHSIQRDSVPLQAPRRIELLTPGHHPLAVLQDPLLSSPPQTQRREPSRQDPGPSSSRVGRSQVSGSDQTAGESTTHQTTPPNQPLRSFQLFKHLVHVLQELNDQTSHEWHAWGTVANKLLERDPDVFTKLGGGSR